MRPKKSSTYDNNIFAPRAKATHTITRNLRIFSSCQKGLLQPATPLISQRPTYLTAPSPRNFAARRTRLAPHNFPENFLQSPSSRRACASHLASLSHLRKIFRANVNSKGNPGAGSPVSFILHQHRRANSSLFFATHNTGTTMIITMIITTSTSSREALTFLPVPLYFTYHTRFESESPRSSASFAYADSAALVRTFSRFLGPVYAQKTRKTIFHKKRENTCAVCARLFWR